MTEVSNDELALGGFSMVLMDKDNMSSDDSKAKAKVAWPPSSVAQSGKIVLDPAGSVEVRGRVTLSG